MSIFDNAISFTKAMAVQIAAGCPMSTEEEINSRKNICLSCPELNKEEFRCNVCNCYLTIKIPLKTSTCPKGYWEQEKEDNNE